jgi:hypothetical protein
LALYGEGNLETVVEGTGEETQTFLYEVMEMGGPRTVRRQHRQSLLTPMRGVSWLAREWLMELKKEEKAETEGCHKRLACTS